jgi:S1-C subfamily serine protease
MRLSKIVFLAAMAPLTAAAQTPAPLPQSDDQTTQMKSDTSDRASQDRRLGIAVIALNSELRTHFGAPADGGLLVAKVEPGSPAEKAGIRVGDVLTTINSQKVSSAADITSQMGKLDTSKALVILVIRDHAEQTLKTNLAEPSSSNEDRDSTDQPTPSGR